MAAQTLARTSSPGQFYRATQNSAQSQGGNQPPAKRQKISPTDSPSLLDSPRPLEPSNLTPSDIRQKGTNGFKAPSNMEATSSQRPNGMGPPQKPNKQAQESNKELDYDKSTDVLSGIVNIEEEEEALRSNARHNPHTSRRGFGGNSTDPASSFLNGESQLSSDQSNLPQQSAEQLQRNRDVQEERIEAEFLSEHLNHPFIRGGPTFGKLHGHAMSRHIKLPHLRQHGEITLDTVPAAFATADSRDGYRANPNRVAKKDAAAHNLAATSIAAKEKLRDLLEAVQAVARARQQGSDGNVPEDFVDIAIAADGSGTGPSKTTRIPSFNNKIVTKLRQKFDGATSTESRRKEKRAHRLAKALVADPTGVAPIGTDLPSTPGSGAATPGLVAPEPRAAPSVKRKANEKPTQKEENAARITANVTASHMVGKKSKYSWMNTGAASSSKSVAPSAMTRVTGATGLGATKAGGQAKKRKFGDFREDGPQGANVQLRDWITVLETDAGQRRTLVKSLADLQ